MVSFGLHELLEKSFADGFTVEGLGIATDIPAELINRYFNDGKVTQEEIQSLEYLIFFLMSLYVVNTDSDTYLKDMVTTLNSYFKISTHTISKYLSLDENELHTFLERPDSSTTGDSITKKLTHLFITFIRDKRHSM